MNVKKNVCCEESDGDARGTVFRLVENIGSILNSAQFGAENIKGKVFGYPVSGESCCTPGEPKQLSIIEMLENILCTARQISDITSEINERLGESR